MQKMPWIYIYVHRPTVYKQKLGQHLTPKHFPLVFAQILKHICFGNMLAHFIITFFFYQCCNERVYCQEYWEKTKFKANIQFLLWRVNAECLNL